jgi:hypothetical protein
LRQLSGPAAADTDRIESFLLHCDMVKFAKYIPGKTEHEAAAEDALRILEISRRPPVTATPPTGD